MGDVAAPSGAVDIGAADANRRAAVLRSALLSFARFGYRKTSMQQVAEDADISRPGLYFLFASKQALFTEAVEQSLREDLNAVERALGAGDADLQTRLLHAFDAWAGRYIGPLTHDVPSVVEDNAGGLGPVATGAPQRFAHFVTDAIATHRDPVSAERLAQTLISASIGIKHQVDSRDDYLARLEQAIDALLGPR